LAAGAHHRSSLRRAQCVAFRWPTRRSAQLRVRGTAARALDQLDDAYATWTAGVRGLGTDGLSQSCGPAEGPFADASLAALVLHINREALHHGAEIALLRDLYERQGSLWR
jgi:hypothetical protein